MNDLRFAFRQLLKNPGFTAVAVLTLALGIGANTAIFNLLNAVLVRPLPFRDPDRLVWISNPAPGDGLPGLTRRSNFMDWQQLNHSFESLGAYIGFSERMSYTMTDHGEPTRLEGVAVTERFLETLGVLPALGRGFVRDECQRNGPRAIILTDRFWRGRFQADRRIVGSSVTINNKPWLVVGLLPRSFDFSDVFTPGARAVDFLRPHQDAPGYENWGNMMAVVGRLKQGVTVRAAQAEFELLNHQLHTAHPERGSFGARLTSLREKVSGSFYRPLVALACAAFCVLVIACANLSNLLLARGAARRKELAVRVALGAARTRLIRQLLTEALLLAGSGALLGLMVAHLTTYAIARASAFSVPLLQGAQVDITALGFTLMVTLATAVGFGLLPALQLSQADPHEDLKDRSPGVIRGPGASRFRQGLIITEVAAACVLLIGTGLFLHSLVRLLELDLGFRPAQALTWRIVPNREFSNHQQEVSFYEELVRRINGLPGIESATLAATLPFELNDVVRVHPKGAASHPAEIATVFLREVGAMNYFKTLGISLRAGRDFDSNDAAAVPKPVVLNATMARSLWPGRDPLDQIVVLENPPDPPVECKVVGVVGDVRQSALEQLAGAEMYMFGWGGRRLVVRTSQPLPAIVPAVRRALSEFNPAMAVNEFMPLTQMVDRIISPKRLVASLTSLFSFLALLLASLGIYGVIAYSVSQRTHEIGLRLALGSSQNKVLWLVIKEGMTPAIIGCAVGLIAGVFLTRGMQALLFEVSPADPVTLLSSTALLLCVALGACWLPAQRAAKVDPMEALRYE